MLENLIDTKAEEFVDEYVNSLIAHDIILFYHHNPSTEAKATDLAVLLGRRREDVTFEANHLARKDILKRNREGAYVYNPSPSLVKEIDEFVSLLDQREERLLVVASILEKENTSFKRPKLTLVA